MNTTSMRNNGYWHLPASRDQPLHEETACGIDGNEIQFSQAWTPDQVLAGEAGYDPCPTCFAALAAQRRADPANPDLTTDAARIVAAIFPNSPEAQAIRQANNLPESEPKPEKPTRAQIAADRAELRRKYGEKRF